MTYQVLTLNAICLVHKNACYYIDKSVLVENRPE